MKLSTQTDISSVRFGDEAAIRMIAMSGFDAIDYSMFGNHDATLFENDSYRDYALKLRRTAEEYGIFFNQSHAPFPTFRVGDDAYNKVTYRNIVRSLEVSSILGVDTVIIHPTDVGSRDASYNLNMEIYSSLLPYAKEYGLRLALENMWGSKDGVKYPNVCSTAEDFNRYLDALDRRYFVGCLDIGHCGLVGENAPDMIHAMGHDRIKALHVHDNDNRDDLHLFPFTSKLDWVAITKALADIDYDGVFTFEADNTLKHVPTAFHTTTLKYLHDIGRQLIKMIEANK